MKKTTFITNTFEDSDQFCFTQSMVPKKGDLLGTNENISTGDFDINTLNSSLDQLDLPKDMLQFIKYENMLKNASGFKIKDGE